MRAAFSLLLLSTPALAGGVRAFVPQLRPLPFVGAPRLAAPSLNSTLVPLSAPALSPSLAPSLIPGAVASPVLPALAAAQNGAPSADSAKPLPAAQAAAAEAAETQRAPEAQAADAAKAFDGSVAAPAADGVAAELPPVEAWRAAKGEDAEWIASVMEHLRESKTGRRVLDDVEALARRRGRPVIIDVAALANNAEVRYDSGLLVLDKGNRKKHPRLFAPIMAHELTHVLQKAADFIPVDALEMEIESYTVEARVWDELLLPVPKSSFALKAKTRLQKDPDAFFAWLADEYKKNRILHGTSMESYVEWLNVQREKSVKKLARYDKRVAAAERVIQTMTEAKMPQSQIDAHRAEEIEPALRDRKDEETTLAWIDRDLKLLSTPEGQKRFRDYSRAVIRRARAMLKPAV